MNHQKATDEQLVAAFRAGDPSALAQLMLRHQGLIESKAAHFAISPSDQEDFMQEGWLAFLKAVRRFQAGQGVPFGAFLALCVKNRMISHYRRGRRFHEEQGLLDAQAVVDESGYLSNPEQSVLSEEYVESVLINLQTTLSAFEYQVLVLFVQGLSYEDMAGKLGVDQKGVSNALQRIRRKMKKAALPQLN